MCRRFLADEEDFSEEKLKAAGWKGMGTVDDLVQKIFDQPPVLFHIFDVLFLGGRVKDMAKFSDIIGQEQIKEHLQNAIATNKVSHAYYHQ